MYQEQGLLTRLTIQSFKSLEWVDLELGVVNVFIGANGSGKSNLLEALGYLSAASSGQLDDQALLRRGVRPGPAGSFFPRLQSLPAPPPTRIVGEFAADRGVLRQGLWRPDRSIPVDKLWHRTVGVVDATGVERYKNDFLLSTEGAWIQMKDSPSGYGSESDRERERATTSALADYGIFAPNTPTLRGMVVDITQRDPVGLAGGQLATALKDLLKPKRGRMGSLDLDVVLELLDWVGGIAVGPAQADLVSASIPTTPDIIRFVDRWMREDSRELAAPDASEGALYLLFALVLALHPRAPRIFAIENLDQNMHPRLARAAVRLFCSQLLAAIPARQAFLTTHNPLVLDGLDLRDDRIRLFTVGRGPAGATRVDRVPVSAEMLQAIDDGLALSNLWLMGRLGGVPDIF